MFVQINCSSFRFRDGATLNVLAEALDDLRDKLYGVKDIGFTGDSKDICQYAADLLGPSKYSIVSVCYILH